MKLEALTPEQLHKFEHIGDISDANFFADKLARLRHRYALAHARHQQALDLEDETIMTKGVTITVSSRTHTLSFSADELDLPAGFLSIAVGQEMSALKDEIIGLLQDEGMGFREAPSAMGAARQELHELCMPGAPATPIPISRILPHRLRTAQAAA